MPNWALTFLSNGPHVCPDSSSNRPAFYSYPWVSKHPQTPPLRRQRRGRWSTGVVLCGGPSVRTQTTNRSNGLPRTMQAAPSCSHHLAHASHFMKSISKPKEIFNFPRASIITVRCGVGDRQRKLFLLYYAFIRTPSFFFSNYRGVMTACHPGADFQFNWSSCIHFHIWSICYLDAPAMPGILSDAAGCRSNRGGCMCGNERGSAG